MSVVSSLRNPKYVFTPGALVRHRVFGDGTIVGEDADLGRDVEFPVYDEETNELVDVLIVNARVSDLEIIDVPILVTESRCDVVPFDSK